MLVRVRARLEDWRLASSTIPPLILAAFYVGIPAPVVDLRVRRVAEVGRKDSMYDKQCIIIVYLIKDSNYFFG